MCLVRRRCRTLLLRTTLPQKIGGLPFFDRDLQAIYTYISFFAGAEFCRGNLPAVRPSNVMQVPALAKVWFYLQLNRRVRPRFCYPSCFL